LREIERALGRFGLVGLEAGVEAEPEIAKPVAAPRPPRKGEWLKEGGRRRTNLTPRAKLRQIPGFRRRFDLEPVYGTGKTYYQVECLACGAVITGDGLAIASHRRSQHCARLAAQRSQEEES
jgi:hypothetical protein